jgi:hypothetical protein
MKEISTAIKTVIKNCILSKGVKIESLPTFDIEYLFLNIRGKSVGEEIEVNVICPDDEDITVPVTISVDDIKVVKNKDHNKQIEVDDSIMMEMKYPSLEQFIKNNFDFSGSNLMDQSFDLVASCIDKIYQGDEVWSSSDVTQKELIDFLDQMNAAQFQQIEKFFETMPKLSHTVKIKNPKSGVESEVVLEGLSNFFA